MIIIGVDPGSCITGFGIVEHLNNTSKAIDFGTIRPPQKSPLEKKYFYIFTALDHLLTKYKPRVLSVKTQFVNKNVQSAIKLGFTQSHAKKAIEKVLKEQPEPMELSQIITEALRQ